MPTRSPLLPIKYDAGLSNPFGTVAALEVPQLFAKDGETSLEARQREDPELLQVINFLENGALPEDGKRA